MKLFAIAVLAALLALLAPSWTESPSRASGGPVSSNARAGTDAALAGTASTAAAEATLSHAAAPWSIAIAAGMGR